MARYLFRSVLLLIFLNLLVKPVWIFGIDRKMQVLAGYESYGLYFSYLSFTVIFNILADAGITIYVQQHLASQQLISSKWLRAAIQYKTLLSVFYFAITLFIAFILKLNDYGLLIPLLVLQLLLSWLSFSRAILSAMHQFASSSWLSVFDKLLLIVPGLFILYVYCTDCNWDIRWFVWWQVAAAAIAVLLAFSWLARKKNPSQASAQTVSIKEIIRGSLPIAAIVFMMFLHTRADGVLLNLFQGDQKQQTGIYASMYRFVDAATVLSYLASGFLLSFWARHLKQTDIIKETLDKIFRMMMSAAVLVAVVFFFYSKEIQYWFYHTENAQAVTIMKWGMLVLIPCFLIDIFGTVLTSNRKLKIFFIIVAVCTIINIGLNIIYIPQWQALAPAVIAIITQTIFAGALIFVCYKNWKTLPHYGSVLRIFLMAAILVVCVFLIRQSVILPVVQLLFTGIIWVVILFLLNLFSLQWIVNWREEI